MVFSVVLREVAKVYLSLLGYSVDLTLFERLKEKRRIIIFPHTSRFEAMVGCPVCALDSGLMSFGAAKKFMDHWFIGVLLKYFGGFRIDATDDEKKKGTVEQMIKYMKENPSKSLLLSPEGRLIAAEWKSGFFHIARLTGVPICVGGIDYINHEIRLDPHDIYVREDQNYEDCVNEIKAVYANSGLCPLFPENSNPKIVVPEGKFPTSVDIVSAVLMGALLVSMVIKLGFLKRLAICLLAIRVMQKYLRNSGLMNKL